MELGFFYLAPLRKEDFFWLSWKRRKR